MRKQHPVYRAVAVALVAVVGSVYFAAAAIYAGPITPLKVRYIDEASAVLEPYLYQNWQLFAPDPISEDRGLLARARCSDGSTTEFIDVTSEHIDAIHATRLFPSRMSRIVSNGMLQLFLQDPYAAKFRERVEDDQADEEGAAQVPLTEEEIQVRQVAEESLVRFAAHELGGHCAHRVESVQLRYMFHRFPRWSQRDQWESTGEVEVAESAWAQIS